MIGLIFTIVTASVILIGKFCMIAWVFLVALSVLLLPLLVVDYLTKRGQI